MLSVVFVKSKCNGAPVFAISALNDKREQTEACRRQASCPSHSMSLKLCHLKDAILVCP